MKDSATANKKSKKERCYLQDVETNILRELLREWNQEPDKKSRDAFVTGTVLPKIQQLNLEKFGPEKISRCKESKKLWEKRVKNHKPYKEKQVFKLERKRSLRWVVGRVKASEIDDLVKATHPGIEKGDKVYPGLYQKCLSSYMKSMSKGEKEDLELERKKWQLEGPPMELRIKFVISYMSKALLTAG